MSNRINVTFVHPTNGQEIEVELEDTLTATSILNELIDACFIPDNISRGGYTLLIKDSQKEISGLQTVIDGGGKDGSVIRVVFATCSGGFDFVQLWQDIYPYLDQIGTVITMAGAAVGVGTWIKKKFSREFTPKQLTDIVTDKEFWNTHELALKLNITNEEAKKLLKGYGYKWERHYALFYKTDKTVEIIKKKMIAK
jgi:hypothetical protein